MTSLTNFSRTKSHEDLFHKANKLAIEFSGRAAYYDEYAKFPFDNFSSIKDAELLDLTIPQEIGGKGAGLYDFILLQETIAQGDGPTALSLGWHLGIIMNEAVSRSWPEETFLKVCTEVIHKKKLLNSAHSEAKTGSPARGGQPGTTARKLANGGWVLNGRKTFTSLAPILDYFIVSATIEGTEEVGEFLLTRGLDGLSIEETWNSISMRATRSDDLVLSNVTVLEDGLLFVKKKERKGPKPQGWLLHIPGCYLGIAIAARNEAVSFAESYQPNSLPYPIKEAPKVRERIGKIDADLAAARHFLYSVARQWDEEPDRRSEMSGDLAAVKYIATNTAISVVDEAMRIVGAKSLQADSPLQRYYRDVRAGLHNPPADELTLELLAKRAFQ